MVHQVYVHGAIAVIAVAMGLFLSWGGSSAHAQVEAEAESKPSLRELVETYYRCGDSRGRSQAASAIVSAAEDDIDKVAAELRNIQLWTDQPSAGTWTIRLPSGDDIEVLFRLPQGYKPNQKLPVIVAMPLRGVPTRDALDRAIKSVGQPGTDHAWVMPAKPVGGSFHQRVAVGGDLPALMREIRRRIRVDCERVYLFGIGDGGDAAWMTAIMYSSEFAGVMVAGGYPRIQYPQQAYTLFLPNLRDLPVLALWNGPGAPGHSKTFASTVFNRAIAEYAKRSSLRITGVELTDDWGTFGLFRKAEREIAGILSERRPDAPFIVQKWFRIPEQGDCGWLRATEIAGDVWEDDQLSIVPAPTTDGDRFITDTIAEKSAFVGGRIDGQTLRIETRRCGGVELRLSPEHVDFEKPITIVCNGRKRFEGLIRPSVSDLLESAYEDWDFQHPVYARKTFAIRTDSPFEGP